MTDEDISIDLKALDDIMSDLTDAPENSEKRKNALTKNDVLIIAKIVKAMSHTTCAMGFEPEEIAKVKTILKVLNGGILAVGYSILAAVGAGMVALSVWSIKHGILELTHTGGKQ
jgi:hypothetical protein